MALIWRVSAIRVLILHQFTSVTLLFSLSVLCSCRIADGWYVFVWLRVWLSLSAVCSKLTNSSSLTNPDEMILLVCEWCLTLPRMHCSVLNDTSVLCLKRISCSRQILIYDNNTEGNPGSFNNFLSSCRRLLTFNDWIAVLLMFLLSEELH